MYVVIVSVSMKPPGVLYPSNADSCSWSEVAQHLQDTNKGSLSTIMQPNPWGTGFMGSRISQL